MPETIGVATNYSQYSHRLYVTKIVQLFYFKSSNNNKYLLTYQQYHGYEALKMKMLKKKVE